MTNYTKISGKQRNAAVPQTQPIPGRESEMHQNVAGGYSFNISDLARLRRFVILGVDGNTYYQTQKELVVQNVEVLTRALDQDPMAVVNEVVDVLRNGRSRKPDAAIFVLAMAASYKIDEKENTKAAEVRSYALSKLPEAIRIPTHLFQFAQFVQDMRGWGRGLRKAFANWYLSAPVERLAMHSWKYKSRNGWSHADLLRLSHPSTTDEVRNAIFQYMAKPDESGLTKRVEGIPTYVEENTPLAQIAAAEELLHLEGTDKATVKRAVDLITNHRLTHEAVPGHLKNVAAVWEALAQSMPVNATVRNLAKMTAVGYISPLSRGEALVLNRLTNRDEIQRSGIHPMALLIGLRQYQMGKGQLGSLTWTPSQNVADALDQAFYTAFRNVVPTGRRILLAVDDSGSMQSGYGSHALKSAFNMTVAEAAAAMALVTLKTEPNAHLISYASRYREVKYSRFNRISDMLSLFHVGEGTDTSLPLQYVLDKKMDVDAVVSYTDNNTWGASGGYGWGSSRATHVATLHKQYANRVGHPVKFVNMAMEANGSSDVDPTNTDMLELVGLDASAPSIISEFVAGNL